MERARPTAASPDLERRLIAYAAMAGAALAAGTQDAAAATITYTVNEEITDSGLSLDIDQNGSLDFYFINFSGDSYLPGRLYGIGADGNGFFGIPKSNIGLGLTLKGSYMWPNDIPSEYFTQTGLLGVGYADAGGLIVPLVYGQPTSQYYSLPVLFNDENGDQHAGWIRIKAELTAPYTLSARIGEVGYESTPFTDIHIPDAVPEPASLGLLALGAAGVALRRRKAQASNQN